MQRKASPLFLSRLDLPVKGTSGLATRVCLGLMGGHLGEGGAGLGWELTGTCMVATTKRISRQRPLLTAHSAWTDYMPTR
jgi:hypothetical protein